MNKNELVDFSKVEGFNVSERYAPINTGDLVSQFETAGFTVTSIQKSRVTNSAKEGFQTHLLRLRHPEFSVETGGLFPEIVVKNSYDGSSALKIMLGLYRLVCANGLIMGTSYFNASIRHVGDARAAALEAANELMDHRGDLLSQVEALSAVTLSQFDVQGFANWAVTNLMDIPIEDVNKLTLTVPQRQADTGHDLFTIMNIIQERLMHGGVHYVSRNAAGWAQVRQTRRVNSIAKSTKINQELWDAASRFEKTGSFYETK